MTDKSKEYKVGYRKPPKSGQFRKGLSGNPRGRAKGGQNLKSLLEKALNTQVIINENGKRRAITKLDAVILQIVNKAASGDFKATQQLLHLVLTLWGKEDNAAVSEFPISREDQETIQQIAGRMQMIINAKGE